MNAWSGQAGRAPREQPRRKMRRERPGRYMRHGSTIGRAPEPWRTSDADSSAGARRGAASQGVLRRGPPGRRARRLRSRYRRWPGRRRLQTGAWKASLLLRIGAFRATSQHICQPTCKNPRFGQGNPWEVDESYRSSRALTASGGCSRGSPADHGWALRHRKIALGCANDRRRAGSYAEDGHLGNL